MATEHDSIGDRPAVTVVSQSATTLDGGNVTAEAGVAKTMASTTPPASSSNLQTLTLSEPSPYTLVVPPNGGSNHESQPVAAVQSPVSDLTRSTPGVSPSIVGTQLQAQNGPLPPGVHQPKLGDGGPAALETVGGTRFVVKIAANEAASQPVKKTKGRFKVLDAPILPKQQQNGSGNPAPSVVSPLPPMKPMAVGDRSVSTASIPAKPSQSSQSERSLSSGHSSNGGSPQGNQNVTPVPQPPPIVKKKGRFVVMSAEAGDAKAIARQASQLQVQSVASAEVSVSSAPSIQHQVGLAVTTEQKPPQQPAQQAQQGGNSSQSSTQHVVAHGAAVVQQATSQNSGDTNGPSQQTIPAQITRTSVPPTNHVQQRTGATTANVSQAPAAPSHEVQQQPIVVKGNMSASPSPVPVAVEPKLPPTVTKPKANQPPPRPTPASTKPPSAFDSKGGETVGLGKVFYFLDQMKQEVTEADRTIKTMHAEAKHLKERNKQLEAKVRDMEKKWSDEKSSREAAETRVKALKKKLRELKAVAGESSMGVIPTCEAPLSAPNQVQHVASSASQEKSRSRSSSIGYTDESVAPVGDSTVNGKTTVDSSVAVSKLNVKTTVDGAMRSNEPDTPHRKPPSSDGYQSAGEVRKALIEKDSPSRSQRRESDPDSLANGAGPSMVDTFDPLKNANRMASSMESIDTTSSSMNNTMNLRPRPQHNGIPVMVTNPAMMVNGGEMGSNGNNGVGMNVAGFNMASMQQQPQPNMMMNQGGIMPHQMGLALQQQMMQQAAVAMGQMQPMANNGQQDFQQQNWAPYAMTNGQAGNQYQNTQAFVQQNMQMNGGNGHAMNGNGHAMNGNGHAMNGNGHTMNGNGHAMNGNGHTMNGSGHQMNGNGHMNGGPHQQQQQQQQQQQHLQQQQQQPPKNGGGDPFDMLAWRGPGGQTQQQQQQTTWTGGQGLT